MSTNPYADLFHLLSEDYLAAEKRRREDPNAVPGGGRKVAGEAMGVKCPVCGTWQVNSRVTCSGLSHDEIHEPTRCVLVPVVEKSET